MLAPVVAGKMNKGIAAELGISEQTIKIHRASAVKKTRAGSLPEPVVLAQTAGLCTTKVQSQYA